MRTASVIRTLCFVPLVLLLSACLDSGISPTIVPKDLVQIDGLEDGAYSWSNVDGESISHYHIEFKALPSGQYLMRDVRWDDWMQGKAIAEKNTTEGMASILALNGFKENLLIYHRNNLTYYLFIWSGKDGTRLSAISTKSNKDFCDIEKVDALVQEDVRRVIAKKNQINIKDIDLEKINIDEAIGRDKRKEIIDEHLMEICGITNDELLDLPRKARDAAARYGITVSHTDGLGGRLDGILTSGTLKSLFSDPEFRTALQFDQGEPLTLLTHITETSQTTPPEEPVAGAEAPPKPPEVGAEAPPEPPVVGAAAPPEPPEVTEAAATPPVKINNFDLALSSKRKQLKPDYAIVRVFFATDRNPIANTMGVEKFGASRSTLRYGTCEVSIPRDHRMGELESPSIWRLEFREDPAKHVVLLSAEIVAKDQFFAKVVANVNQSPKNNAFLFVHGYNVTFEDAAKRTAQITYDLGFEGAPIFYSWPSQGTPSPLAYTEDEQNIEWAQANLKNFLEDFFTRSDAHNIYLIAHSMGNRALTRAVASLLADNPTFRNRLKEVILTAPDIDAEVFKRDIAPALTATGRPITLYASSVDKALLASKVVHGYPRAGDAGQNIVVLPRIETIDATLVDTSFVGHSYFAEERSVLSDIYYLIRNDQRADKRFGLRPVDAQIGRYWEFRQ